MTMSSEADAVQFPMVSYAVEAGWTFIDRDEATRLRRGETGSVLWSVLVDQIIRLNPGVIENPGMAEDAAKNLVRVKPNIEGNLDAWEYLRGLKTVFVPSDNQERNVKFLDTGGINRNTFHVTVEYQFTNGTKTIRPDVMFLVNGIPVIVVEAKAATQMKGVSEAFDQIVRYHEQAPELMSLVQIYSLNQLVQFYYGATWSLSAKTVLNWRDELAGTDYEQLVKSFVHPERVLRVLTDFILFTRSDEELSKVILRPHQMRAVDKVVERAGDTDQTRGLVWHTQGSGKTFSMITAAEQLIRSPIFENPTVLMLVDRNELEAQLFSNLAAVGFGHIEMADSKRHLQELLDSDYRGLLVSTIHKFDKMPANVNTRDNVIVLVDEAHRTTSGDLGNYLMGALPNATYIGFTGTPIDKTQYGKGTFKIFGGDDERGYLDKYSIRQSIEDGATVPLHYTLAPNDLTVDRDVLEAEFLALRDAEGMSDVEDLDKVLDQAVTLRNMLKNEDRMARVAAHVAEHYRSTIEPMGYKAFLVGVDREACAHYKVELDKHLPAEWSTVVYSAGHNDPPELARWHLSEDDEREVRKAFRRPDDLPKILIVTQKLLTGFDAPILYAMYLDKPMRDHVLLQSIARVNRPYEDDTGRRKQSGLIVDYVGVFENLEKALAFDSEDVAGLIEDLDVLRKHFADKMTEAENLYLAIGASQSADKAVEAVVTHFHDSETREAFYAFYRSLEELYEILSPDAFLRPYIDKFARLSAMYRILRTSFDQSAPVEKAFLRKTAELVRKHTQSGTITDPDDVYILGPDALEVIAASDKPDTVKIFNLIKLLQSETSEKAGEAPYMLSIGERAERIAERFHQRQIDTQEALDELMALLLEARQAEEEQAESGLAIDAFSIAWLLNREDIDDALGIGQVMDDTFTDYPHWRTSGTQEAAVRTALYKELVPQYGDRVSEMSELVGRLIDMLRRSDR